MKKFKCKIAFLFVLTAFLPSCLSFVNIIDHDDPNFFYGTNLSICCLEGTTYRFSAALTNTQARVSEYGFCYQSESDSVEYVVAENSVENIYTADVTIEKNYGKTYNVDFVMHNGIGDKRSIASSEFTVNPLSSFVQFDSLITLSYDRQSKEAIVELACSVDEIVDVSAWGITYGKSQDLTQNITTIESTGDFNGKILATIPECLPGEVYYIRPYVADGNYYAYGDSLKYDVPELDPTKAYDLSEHGTANCYIVSNSGVYKFKSVKGNSDYPVGTIFTVEVLWESFGTSVAPNKGELISKTEYHDGFVVFSVPDSFKEGNAVVAAKDSEGTILWSWHIWLSDSPKECVYINDAGIVMDRNLGATSCGGETQGEYVASYGLLYQWGRKEPFLSSSGYKNDLMAVSTSNWTSVKSRTETGTIEYSISHPTTFICSNEYNEDWLYSGSSMRDETRWGDRKTVYDPCPLGWKVPLGGSEGIWQRLGLENSVPVSGAYAYVIDMSEYCQSEIFYPLCGYIDYDNGCGYTLRSVSSYGFYWDTDGYMWFYDPHGNIYGNNYCRSYYYSNHWGRGCSVRCQKDQ